MLVLCSASLYSRDNNNFNINVHLTEITMPATIKIDGSYEVLNYQYKSSIASGKDASFNVETHSSGVKIDGLGTYSAGVLIQTENGFSVNGNEYYDDIILVNYNGKTVLVNSLDIENYVMGVLPYEMSPSWHIEALKAQAIAARTYALYHYSLSSKNADRVFDIDNTTKYQVYKGKGLVNASVVEAVSKTKDEVITYKGKVIGAFFHSICGGYTDSTRNAFGTDLVYLRGSACSYCKDKIEEWTGQVHLDKVKQLFGFSVDKSSDVKITLAKRNKRVEKVQLSGGGKTVEVNAREFRSKIGAGVVQSLNFSIKPDGHTLNIVGVGKGHGVGMCQWGAYGMANANKSYKDIIKQYYNPTTLISYKKLSSIEADG